MNLQKPAAGRHFTDAARLAAQEAKRRKREEASPLDAPELFVVRASGGPSRFGWEIRRFGGVVLARGTASYASEAAARAAGALAFAGRDPVSG